jgi:broad specificity phosphatase PhoE
VILLARHGETDWNVPPQRVMGSADVPLNERGREQARALARELAGEGIAAVRSSHLARARETAEVVAAALGLAVEVDERLAESRRGAWEGRLLQEIARDEPDAWRAWRRAGAEFRFPGGESLAEHAARVAAALADLARGPLPALAVCHGGTIRCAAALARPEGLDAFHELEVPNALVVRIDPARVVSPEAPA